MNHKLKCMAHSACGGELNSDLYCPVCIAPELEWMNPGKSVSEGESIHLTMIIKNRSKANRPLIIRQAWIRVGAAGEWSQMILPWDQIEAGQQKPVHYTSSAMENKGDVGIEILFVVSLSHGFVEESYALSTHLSLRVESERDIVVQQNINYSAEAAQQGATIYAPLRVQSETKGATAVKAAAKTLKLHRANRYESMLGLVDHPQPKISPATQFSFEDPVLGLNRSMQPIGVTESKLIFGRSRTKMEGGTNDVRLLFDGLNGQVDEEASLELSRQHFCLYVERGQLKVRSLSPRGIVVDRQPLGPEKSMVLRDRSQITLQAKDSTLRLKITFKKSNGHVSEVTISRQID